MKRLLALLVSLTMLFSFSLPVSANDLGAINDAGAVHDGGDPAAAIAAAKAADPNGFAYKVELLRSSEALMDLFKGAPSPETVDFYLDFFALHSTVENVQNFVASTVGKHFVVSGTPDNPQVMLKDGKPLATKGSCCACWRAWVASAAYMVGTGMVCGAVGVGGAFVSGGVGAVSGFVCGGVFWAIEKLPDFDAACR
ncbi:MAG: hypothetical protein Q4A16_03345 [Lautropia sp.]|nr:hypothetical protein [Lautropia sp.]